MLTNLTQKGDFKESVLTFVSGACNDCLLRALNFGEFISGKAQQALPPSLEGHEGELSLFMDLCRNVCLKLLQLFAIALKVRATCHLLAWHMNHVFLQIPDKDGGEKWFSSRHDPSSGPSGSILRLLYVRSHT